jgi:hypothetical protein
MTNADNIVSIVLLFLSTIWLRWDEHLPDISMAYRAAEHDTTGNTPNYMMLGRGYNPAGYSILHAT